MAPEDVPPARPRRDRPLTAPGRETPPEPPTATTPPTGPAVTEFPMTDDDLFERDDTVEVSFTGPTLQKRWTVALRFILAIPHYIWWYLLSIALGAVAVVSWFAALFTGRVPTGLARFMSQVVEYQTRVSGYAMLLLTDEYPPFALEDNDYAINVRTSPGELNRAAVFFRFILIFPSAVLSWLLLVGAGMVGAVGWLLALIMGRLPTPLWEANAAVLRYYTRAQAFYFMLSAEQPKRALGDPPANSFADPDALPELSDRPRIVRLVLSTAARRLVIFFGVAAAVVSVAFFSFAVVNAIQSSEALEDLEAAYERLAIANSAFEQETQSCAFTGGEPGCVQPAIARFVDAFDEFAADVQAIDFPATVDASPLIGDAQDCAAALRAMGAAENPPAYQSAFVEFQNALQQFNADYNQIAFETQLA